MVSGLSFTRFTTAQARQWLDKHRLVRMKGVDTRANVYCYRIREPTFSRYATKRLKNGVELVLGISGRG